MPTSWEALDAVATTWREHEYGFPPVLDGGDAFTTVWADTYDGGGAVAGDYIVSGAAPYDITWTTLAGP